MLKVFGALQACASVEVEALQVQVEALDSQLHSMHWFGAYKGCCMGPDFVRQKL
jgi:hypothetical protein